MPRSLDQRSAPAAGLDSYWTDISPVVSIFGTARLDEVSFADVSGTLGQVEATHTQVPENTVRHYLCMQYSHDDGASARFLAPVLIVGDPTGFPACALDDAESVISGQLRAIRNVVVPPRGFIGARISTIGVGARIILRVVFVDLDLGEYLEGVST